MKTRHQPGFFVIAMVILFDGCAQTRKTSLPAGWMVAL